MLIALDSTGPQLMSCSPQSTQNLWTSIRILVMGIFVARFDHDLVVDDFAAIRAVPNRSIGRPLIQIRTRIRLDRVFLMLFVLESDQRQWPPNEFTAPISIHKARGLCIRSVNRFQSAEIETRSTLHARITGQGSPRLSGL